MGQSEKMLKKNIEMTRILIIDDDKMICEALAGLVEHMGHQATSVYTLKDGIAEAAKGTFDVVFLDIRLPDGNGLSVLPEIKETASEPDVIIMTGEGDPDGAELAIKNGAWDYIEKPASVKQMTLPLIRALQYRSEKKAKKSSRTLDRRGIVGNSPEIKRCLDLLAQAADSDASVIITGETGTGKELFASAVHKNSPRRSGNFVVVDCAALPDTLVESTLFGYEKGAFTGADKPHKGLIKQADGGTLFLDEVGELPLRLQKSFLRVIQERSFRPVGSKQEIKSDFRLVAATNRDLDEMVRDGKFRSDLLYRIHSISITLPPLRERQADIKDLVMHFMSQFCEKYSIATKGFSPDFFRVLANHPWPGNVRELANTMEHILATSGEDPMLYPNHLPLGMRVSLARASVRPRSERFPVPSDSDSKLKDMESFRAFRDAALLEAEREYLRMLMDISGGAINEACRIAKLSRARLYALLKKHHISTHGQLS